MSSTPGTKQVFQQESSEGHSWSGETESPRSQRVIDPRDPRRDRSYQEWITYRTMTGSGQPSKSAADMSGRTAARGNPVRHTDSTAQHGTERNGEERRNGLRRERATCARKRCGGDRGPPSLSRSGRAGPLARTRQQLL